MHSTAMCCQKTVVGFFFCRSPVCSNTHVCKLQCRCCLLLSLSLLSLLLFPCVFVYLCEVCRIQLSIEIEFFMCSKCLQEGDTLEVNKMNQIYRIMQFIRIKLWTVHTRIEREKEIEYTLKWEMAKWTSDSSENWASK